MSKHFSAVLLALPLILQIFNNSFGQTSEIEITIDPAGSSAAIRGQTTQQNTHNFSIIGEYAGTPNLADRVSDIVLEDNQSRSVAFKQFIPGEYVAEREFVKWRYRMKLAPLASTTSAAHTSWITSDSALLFARDLLPAFAISDAAAVRVKVNATTGWQVYGDLENGEVPSKRVVFLTKTARATDVSDSGSSLRLVIAGNWKFSDQQAADFLEEIFSQYAKIFGGTPGKTANVFLLPFPTAVSPGNWEGDTRGNNIVVISSDMPFGTQSIQRLHEQLRHEVFHLWFPNGVKLSGNYDWFYEGFALYESLKLGVALNRLRFDDYLDTLGRAMTIDSMLSDRRSLLDSSNARAANNTVIYARGMLAGYLADIERLRRSNGQQDLSNILRNIYQANRISPQAMDGNKAVLSGIDSNAVTSFVDGGRSVDWNNVSNAVGIEATVRPGSTTLAVTAKPTSSQKRLLNKLGYNNWRKLPVGSK